MMVPTWFWILSGLAILVAAGLTLPVSRLLGAAPWTTFLLCASFGVIVAVTLAPASPGRLLYGTAGYRTCDLDLFETSHPSWPTTLDESGLNVLLFVPVGIAVALLPRWSQVAAAAVFGGMLPSTIETTQGLVPALGRVCSGADIRANLTGLAIGLIGGLVVIRPVTVLAGGCRWQRRQTLPSTRVLYPAGGEAAPNVRSSLGRDGWHMVDRPVDWSGAPGRVRLPAKGQFDLAAAADEVLRQP